MRTFAIAIVLIFLVIWLLFCHSPFFLKLGLTKQKQRGILKQSNDGTSNHRYGFQREGISAVISLIPSGGEYHSRAAASKCADVCLRERLWFVGTRVKSQGGTVRIAAPLDDRLVCPKGAFFIEKRRNV